MIERNIPVITHGRYLVGETGTSNPPLLVGFHGYGETAEQAFARIDAIPGSGAWLRVAVQGLHRFYRGRGTEIAASWMTRQDRELAIADNTAYVEKVVEALTAEFHASRSAAFSGFSQGVAMAFRAAVSSAHVVRAVIACGGDIPPELDAAALSRIQNVLIGRGQNDDWYAEEKLAADERRLREAGVPVTVLRYDARHEWTPQFSHTAGSLLAQLRA